MCTRLRSVSFMWIRSLLGSMRFWLCRLDRSLAMSSFVVAAKSMAGGRTMLKVSVVPMRVVTYLWPRPIAAFDLPIDDDDLLPMPGVPGLTTAGYADLLRELSSTSCSWWIARVCRTVKHTLNFYMRFSDDVHAIHLYELVFPDFVTADDVPDGGAFYPSMSQWHEAIGKRWIARHDDVEFEALRAMNFGVGMSVAPIDGTDSTACTNGDSMDGELPIDDLFL